MLEQLHRFAAFGDDFYMRAYAKHDPEKWVERDDVSKKSHTALWQGRGLSGHD
jgi:hypothetical protein